MHFSRRSKDYHSYHASPSDEEIQVLFKTYDLSDLAREKKELKNIALAGLCQGLADHIAAVVYSRGRNRNVRGETGVRFGSLEFESFEAAVHYVRERIDE
jgi:hypothetical protein